MRQILFGDKMVSSEMQEDTFSKYNSAKKGRGRQRGKGGALTEEQAMGGGKEEKYNLSQLHCILFIFIHYLLSKLEIANFSKDPYDFRSPHGHNFGLPPLPTPFRRVPLLRPPLASLLLRHSPPSPVFLRFPRPSHTLPLSRPSPLFPFRQRKSGRRRWKCSEQNLLHDKSGRRGQKRVHFRDLFPIQRGTVRRDKNGWGKGHSVATGIRNAAGHHQKQLHREDRWDTRGDGPSIN